MANFEIDETAVGNMDNTVDDIAIPALAMDSAQDQKETTWLNDKWPIYWGYFNAVPDLKNAIILKAIWNVGKGYTADNLTTVMLDNITGWGKDSFIDILFNMEIMKRVAGDAFCEIIRNDKGTLSNLKPLDPGSIRIVVDRKGILLRYEQIEKVTKNRIPFTKFFGKKTTENIYATFQPNELFHLSNNRLGDQIHGISDIESLEPVIQAEEESFADLKLINHRQAKPLIMFKLGTDDPAKIEKFISKMEEAINKGDHIYIPADDDTVSWDVVQANVGSITMQWRDDIRNKFYRTIGLPQIVPGGGGMSTESESKVIYKAFEQIVHRDQLALEKQIWNQLALKIDLIHPASISPELKADEAKDAGQQTAFQPSETTVGLE